MTVPTAEEIDAQVEKFVVNQGRMDQIVNGDATTDVGSDDDRSVPSFAKLQKGILDGTNATIAAHIDDLTADAETAINGAGTTQVAAVNGAGTTQVAAVNSAGSTQVGAVNGAGSTQV